MTTAPKVVLWAAAAAALLVEPFVASPLLQNWLFRLSGLVALTVSWNLMANAGLISLGQVVFWACGGYTASILASKAGWPFAPALVAAMLAGSAVGALLAAITGRLRGIYFAIATLSLAEGLRVLSLMLEGVTGGAQGIHLPASASPSQAVLQMAANAFAILAVAASYSLSLGRFQFASRALRNNEDAAQMLGLNPWLFRVAVMALSGAIAAGAGSFNAVYSGYIDPTVAFSLQFTILPQISAVFGGIYTTVGSVLGPVAILALSEATRYAAGPIPGAALFLLGVLLVLCVLFLPHGLAHVLQRMVRKPDVNALAFARTKEPVGP